MPERASLEARLAALFERELKLVVPSFDADLFETGSLDSLVFVDLLLALENEFGLKISLEDLELDNFRSIARLAKFIASRVGQDDPLPWKYAS
jgi:methoxymalonate biosynthesis acyl carrier protein